MNMDRIRLVIADDHGILRAGIRALLAPATDIEVAGEAGDGAQAVELCEKLDADVVLLDVAMPGLGGLEAALQLKKRHPRTRILVLTQYGDREYVRRFLEAGAAGYVLKKAASGLADAIRAVHRGGMVLDPEIARDALDKPSKRAPADSYDSLTDREKQVLKLVAEGLSNKEIAEQLGISVKTAMSHREHVMSKLDLHNRTEMVRFALQKGVLPPR